MGRDAKNYDVFSPHTQACEARALHTRGSRLRRFTPSEKIRKLFCSLAAEKLCRHLELTLAI